MKKKIQTLNAPNKMSDHVHPFCQGWIWNGLIFTGGIAAEDPETGLIVEGGIVEQSTRCFETMRAILEDAGASMDNVLKVTVLFLNFEDKKLFESVYGRYFPVNKPARTSAAVSYIGKNRLIEIDAIAHVDE